MMVIWRGKCTTADSGREIGRLEKRADGRVCVGELKYTRNKTLKFAKGGTQMSLLESHIARGCEVWFRGGSSTASQVREPVVANAVVSRL